MPAFILISGYFAKNFRKEGHYKKLIIKLLVPYVLFEVFYSLFISLIYDKKLDFSMSTPYWLMWFLLSLFCWHIMLYFISKFQYSFAISILIAVLAGYFDNFDKEFSLLRTFTFFPFFLAGFLLKKEHFEYLKSLPVKLLSLLFLSGLFIYIHFSHNISFRWLWASRPYSYYGFEGIEAAFFRLFYFLVMFIACTAFLSLVTSKKTFFSNLGIYTLYTYLLHGFFVRFFIYKKPIVDKIDSVGDFVLIIGFVLLLCFLTTLPFVRKATSILIEPYSLIATLKNKKVNKAP